MPDDLISTADALALLEVSRATLYNLSKAANIKRYQLTGKGNRTFWSKREIEKLRAEMDKPKVK